MNSGVFRSETIFLGLGQDRKPDFFDFKDRGSVRLAPVRSGSWTGRLGPV